jgi:2-polyprenyl-3-methyl-5-hydroxy-6-metoxy-1,4-benzoquinol methylase
MKTPTPPAPLEALASTVYWEQRARRFARESHGLKAVCSFGMPWFYNKAIDWCQRRALAPWFERPAGRSVLDIGCGVGRWSLRFAARGWRVTGLDLSPFMVESARQNATALGLDCTFASGDVRAHDFGTRFDLIFCVTVIQHITDPLEAGRALANLAGHLQVGGELVLLEAAPMSRVQRCDTVVFKARDFEWYRQALAAAGLQIETVRGVDPMPLKTWLLPFYRRMSTPLAIASLAVVTAISLPIDWLLGPYCARRSWHKVIVARHIPGAPGAI